MSVCVRGEAKQRLEFPRGNSVVVLFYVSAINKLLILLILFILSDIMSSVDFGDMNLLIRIRPIPS